MTDLYSPKRVCDILGISQSALRIYTDKYKVKLSTEATGNPRKFTEADLHALAFVVASTGQGKTHSDVLASWDEEYAEFDWEAPQNPTGDAGDAGTALVPMAALQAATALMRDAQRREEEAREQVQAQRDEAAQRERELQEQINQLLRELGKTEGELAAMKASKLKGFWARLLGGGE